MGNFKHPVGADLGSLHINGTRIGLEPPHVGCYTGAMHTHHE